ncbi:hypothetical protein [Trinickia fusca]|uniref:Uncharacterized protein n=1 Tax=Trinickia fusca TaxID=2419777 RepID=A0A494WZL9_9BURK|nr:hypothetical protein [Trinickia fusca]RKP43975.1 hypothetical protein D7S89_23870 [Trinickia fusca]
MGSSNATILTTTVTLPTASYVYVQSDGRVFPAGAAIAALSIWADGGEISNDSVIDWSKTTNAQQHSYNVIGATYLAAGTHVLRVNASTLNGASFVVGAGSNLSVMTSPADTVMVSRVAQDTAPLSFATAGLKRGSPLPHQPLVSQMINTGGRATVALASGRAFLGGAPGDPLTAIYLNGQEPANNVGTWADNDTWKGAENQSPFFNHAFYAQPGNQATVSWDASALPYCEDDSCSGLVNIVNYKVGAGSTLVTLSGMTVAGSAPTAYTAYNRTNYIDIGSSSGVPPTGTNVVLAQADIVIPQGHNGVVLFTGKSRVQGDGADAGGTVSMWLAIDGVQRGSTGIQQLRLPDCVSTRTIGTSYLSAAPGERLAPGTHHVTLYGRADGSFKHMSMTRDLPLLWFD